MCPFQRCHSLNTWGPGLMSVLSILPQASSWTFSLKGRNPPTMSQKWGKDGESWELSTQRIKEHFKLFGNTQISWDPEIQTLGEKANVLWQRQQLQDGLVLLKEHVPKGKRYMVPKWPTTNNKQGYRMCAFDVCKDLEKQFPIKI